MPLELNRVHYVDLNPRQQENYNFHKISAVLADFGFTTLRLTDDWHGADFIALHIDGETFLRVQLKGRLTFLKRYRGKSLRVAFPSDGDWYLYPHDELLDAMLAESNIGNTKSWLDDGVYSFGSLSHRNRDLLEPYLIAGPDLRVG
jgi:hypothetical protein